MLHALTIKIKKSKESEMKKWMAEKKKEVSGMVKFTSETAKEDAVLTQNALEYATRIKEIIDCDYNTNVLDVVKEAWKMKSNMLQTLGANLRQEMNCNVTIQNWNSQFKKKEG